MSTTPTATDIQTRDGNDGATAARKLSITIPSGSSPHPADSEATTVGDLLDLSSTHTSPTVANSPGLEMKIGNATTPNARQAETPAPRANPPTDTTTEVESPPSSSTTLTSSPSPELDAIIQCITGMRQLARTMDSTFDAFGRQTEKVATLAPAVEATHKLKTLRKTFEDQRAERKQKIADLQQRFQEIIPQLVQEHETQVDRIIQDIVAEEVEIRVRKELEAQLPAQLRSDVQLHERQLLEVETKLYNSEARRFNASLASQENMMVPLRPLLIPLPTPEQSPAYIRSPMFTPITAGPGVPLPTPSTAFPPSGPRTGLLRSSLFPKDLHSLLGYNAQDARRLLADYGLIEQDEQGTPTSTGGYLQTPTTPSTVQRGKGKNDEAKNEKITGTDDNSGTREADLTKFMAHIGVPVKMIPNPSLTPGTKPGRPSLRVIITSPTGL